MGDQDRHAELFGQCRSDQDHQHDVGRRHRQPHAEDQAGDGHQDEGEQQVPAGKGDHHGGELEAQTCQADHAHDDARDRAGQRHRHRVARAQLQRLQRQPRAGSEQRLETGQTGGLPIARTRDEEIPERPARRRRDHGDDGVEADAQRRVAGDQQADQGHQRHQEVPPAGQHLAHPHQLGGRQAAHALLHRGKVHQQIDRPEIEKGGKDRDQNDLQIGDLGELAHEERTGPHQRRHDLPAGRGRRFHAAGLRGPVAQPLHQRNREGAGGHDVGDGRTRDRAHAGGGDHGGLRRPAPLASGGGVGEIDEEAPCPRHLQEGAEQHEDEDEGGGDAERQAEDTLRAQRHLARQAVDGVATVGQDARQPLAEAGQGPALSGHGVEQCSAADQSHDQADGTARGLQHHQGRDDSDGDIDLARHDGGRDGVDVERHPETDQDAAGDQRRVDRPADQATRAIKPRDGEHQKTENEDETEMDRPQVEKADGLDAGAVELEQRQRDADDRDDPQDETGVCRRGAESFGACVCHGGLCYSGVSARVTRARGARRLRDTSLSAVRSRWSTFGPPGRRT